MEEKIFKEAYLNGEIPFEDIDRYTYMWGMSDMTITLRAYLGLSAEEERTWVEDSEEALEELLNNQKK